MIQASQPASRPRSRLTASVQEIADDTLTVSPWSRRIGPWSRRWTSWSLPSLLACPSPMARSLSEHETSCVGNATSSQAQYYMSQLGHMLSSFFHNLISISVSIKEHEKEREKKKKKRRLPFFLTESWAWNGRDSSSLQKPQAVEDIRSFACLPRGSDRCSRQLYLREGIHSSCEWSSIHVRFKCYWNLQSEGRLYGFSSLPSVKLQTMFSHALKPSVMMWALFLKDSMIASLKYHRWYKLGRVSHSECSRQRRRETCPA